MFFGELTHANIGNEYTPSIPVVTMSQKDGLQLRKVLESYQAATFNVSPDSALIETPEPIPELIFDGGNFVVHQGSDLLAPIQIKIINHDHKILPKIHTIFDNKIINTQRMSESHSGIYFTFLNINREYSSGEHYLQLEYDGKKSKPVSFNVIKEYDGVKETIIGKGDYAKKLFEQKQSYLDLSQEYFDVEFSSKYRLVVSGEFDNRGKVGIGRNRN